MRDLVQGMIDAGETVMDGSAPTSPTPTRRELVLRRHAAAPTGLDVRRRRRPARRRWPRSRAPVLIVTSRQDHVVPTTDSDSSPPRCRARSSDCLERSYHVATLDYDQELIETTAVAFAKRVTASESFPTSASDPGSRSRRSMTDSLGRRR